MAILLVSTIGPMPPWADALAEQLPDEEIRQFPEIGNAADISCAVVARAPDRLWRKLPNLRLIIALRAGIDDLLADPDLPGYVPVARSAQPDGDAEITEYVILHVLRHHRRLPEYAEAQHRGEWLRLDRVPTGERTVGFMGLGIIARPAAEAVRDLGFRVAAWSRTRKQVPGMDCFHGPDQMADFLSRTEILVNLLAVTPQTRDILCQRTFNMMPEGAAIINIARGEHVVDGDLMAALESGRLSAATLDVYRTEPLPPDDPLWRHPGITIMPHCARRPRAANIIPQVVDNIRRLGAGQPLLQLVDRDAGY